MSDTLESTLTPDVTLVGDLTVPETAPEANYERLRNKPSVNGVELVGNKTLGDLGITALLAEKVDKVEGKGLSTNDFTDAEKSKLSSIESGAQVNLLEGIKKNGTTVNIVNKVADISVPTKTSDIVNDSNFPSDASYVHTDNNYTTSEKTKLSGIEESADVNVIESVKVNGTALTVDENKAVNVTVPTKTSDLSNDAGFITENDVPSASSTTPSLDGTASVGSESAYARGDHVHPTDTSRASASDLSALSSQVDSLYITDTSEGAIASFPDGADMFVESLVVDIEPVQSGTGDPSPTNVRPITGHDAVEVVRCGRNILDLSTIQQGAFDYPGSPLNVTTDYIPIIGGQTYMWSQSASLPGRYLRFYDINKTQIDWQNQYNATNKTFTTVEGTCYMRLMWYRDTSGITPQDVLSLNPQIELGSTATAYEAYHGNTYDINLPSTIYAGTLDLVTGLLTVTHKKYSFSSSDNWRYYESGTTKFWYCYLTDTIDEVASETVTCENGISLMSYGNTGQVRVYIASNPSLDESTDMHALMDGVGFVQTLKTPLTYTLTPTQIKTLLGRNNVWSDGGDVSIEYKADTKLYISKKIIEAISAL